MQMPARGDELRTRDLSGPAAFSLIFLILLLSVALVEAVLVSLDPDWSEQAPWLVALAPPVLLSAVASLSICSRLGIERSATWSMVFASGLIALLVALLGTLGLFVSVGD